jgi:hypothetical protein
MDSKLSLDFPEDGLDFREYAGYAQLFSESQAPEAQWP